MKILIVVDSMSWAIGHLAKDKQKFNKHHNIEIIAVHPRDASDSNVVANFEKKLSSFKPDIIHFEYFRTASQLIENIPSLSQRKLILTHHNQRDKALGHADWHKIGIDHIVTHTEKCKDLLVKKFNQNPDKISVINHGIDLKYFSYTNEEPKEFKVGYVGRIVPWKRLKNIIKASKDLGFFVAMMGKQDKADYWQEICNEGLNTNIDYSYYDCKDEDRLAGYRNMSIFINNSVDGYEEGPMPLLEAMSSGIPVITTLSGVANDICKDNHNCLVIPFENNDEHLKEAIKKLSTDKELRQKLRSNAWDTVKNMPVEKMAYEYSNLYYKINEQTDKLISVIIPTTPDRHHLLIKILENLKNQTFKNFEVIVGIDNVGGISEELKEEIRKQYSFNIKFVETGRKGYNLAMSRNLAVCEAEGEYLVFVDSRICPKENALEIFHNRLGRTADKVWFFGDKGSQKQSFVENFSAVKRKYFIDFGMFNERISKYGGMSQEIRTRWKHQGNRFVYVGEAQAVELSTSKKDIKRREDIIDMKHLLRKMYK